VKGRGPRRRGGGGKKKKGREVKRSGMGETKKKEYIPGEGEDYYMGGIS